MVGGGSKEREGKGRDKRIGVGRINGNCYEEGRKGKRGGMKGRVEMVCKSGNQRVNNFVVFLDQVTPRVALQNNGNQ